MVAVVEQLLPVYSRREVHRRRYPATAAQVREVLLGLRPRDLPITRVLFALRGLPLLLRGRNPLSLVDFDRDTPLIERAERSGFLRVVDSPTQLVLVVVGKFWKPDGGRVSIGGVDEFERFDQPGYAKATWSFELREGAGTTELVTETRVLATDPHAGRMLTAYWLLIRGGSGLIRREMLAAAAAKLG